MNLPYDPAIPLLAMYTKKKSSYLKRHMHPTAVLLTNDKIWKQPVCPPTWMGKEEVVYMYNGIPLTHKK